MEEITQEEVDRIIEESKMLDEGGKITNTIIQENKNNKEEVMMLVLSIISVLVYIGIAVTNVIDSIRIINEYKQKIKQF